MENIFGRLRKLIEIEKISNNEFGRTIGCSSAQITQMLTHEKNFGIDKLLKIISNFPELSTEWLLRGVEPIFKTNSVKITRGTDTSMPQIADFKDKDNENKISVQENSYVIDKLLQRLENQSKEIGRLETENKYLHEQLLEKNNVRAEDAGCAAAM